MKSLYELVYNTPVPQWNYYFDLNEVITFNNPFIDNTNYNEFISSYFRKSGKEQVFKLSQIDIDNLRLPNHICSVFFMGVLLYFKTSFHKKYILKDHDPGYSAFPFIWFLIALFHDSAYQMEAKSELQEISNIDDLIARFNIKHNLLNAKFEHCEQLHKLRKNYFFFVRKHLGVVDHGILGGMLLYDRLIKIRRQKKRLNEDNLFWGKALEKDYKVAGNAISLHNIWLQPDEICKEYKLTEMLNFQPVKFADFPLFYILGVVDTIEPLKAFRNSGYTDEYIMKNLNYEFRSNSIKIENNLNSKLRFNILLDRIKGFKNWLDIRIKTYENGFELLFR
ncbi:hypothetical protein [Niabella beijingensis]|uniref:hypothetical protein n=1 Tax=Niabella beijingensis TaxID=2872700 RepID=UPI001CC1BCE4|nr:hypothetical protein [Niabella beijingensis]MBZ4191723.1 hypothetical protein [Niabella beijingensis]